MRASADAVTDRRRVLGLAAGGVALAASRAIAAPGRDDVALRAVLDGLGKHPDPDAGLRALARFDPARLSPVAALDLRAIRRGLAMDRAIGAQAPGTPQRYVLQLARACGMPMDPRTAHSRLLAERGRLERRAQALFAQLGLKPGSTGEGFAALMARGDGAFADSEAGRADAVAFMNAILDVARADLPRWFGPLPAECDKVSVRAMTPAELALGRGGFRVLPDGNTPGAYVIDLRRIAERPRWTLVCVVHHELLPGHMVQLPIEARAGPHPLRLRYASAFTEGWAIHAEWLALRAGLLADPAAQAGAVHWRLFRVQRALADLAINHDGASEASAVASAAATLGFPAYFAPFSQDAARARDNPGQRVAEMLTAMALDEGAIRASDIRRFHISMLADGARPLGAIAARP